MATPADARRLATLLPEVIDCSTDRALAFEVGGKGFAWSWKERLEPKKPRLPRLDVLAMRCDPEAKAAILESDPAVFFTEPHYNGFPAVLVRLPAVDEATLRALLASAWVRCAPKKLAAAHDLASLAGR
jgi:hypothetical protein